MVRKSGQSSNRVKPGVPADPELLRRGREALEERLGVLSTIRFLRLVAGGRGRWEDIRADWADMTVEEIVKSVRSARRGSRG
jgi:hypothetical protein